MFVADTCVKTFWGFINPAMLSSRLNGVWKLHYNPGQLLLGTAGMVIHDSILVYNITVILITWKKASLLRLDYFKLMTLQHEDACLSAAKGRPIVVPS